MFLFRCTTLNTNMASTFDRSEFLATDFHWLPVRHFCIHLKRNSLYCHMIARTLRSGKNMCRRVYFTRSLASAPLGLDEFIFLRHSIQNYVQFYVNLPIVYFYSAVTFVGFFPSFVFVKCILIAD